MWSDKNSEITSHTDSDGNSQDQQQDRQLAAAAASSEKSSSSSMCTIWNILKFIVFPMFVCGILSLVFIHVVFGKENLPGPVQAILDGDSLDLFRTEDPTNGQVYMWRQANGYSGLDLTIVNALTPEWYSYFDLAVSEWENGNPDSLTLKKQQRSADESCNVLTGVLKICNGDYGPTDWKGVNKLYVNSNAEPGQQQTIRASIGKMNEYYFKPNAEEAKRQYTMCHEIGHGLGLPHTDERFWNRDQGNCMDYTRRPANNKQPDTVNFKTLAEVYGVVGGTMDGTMTQADVSAPQQQQPIFQQPNNNNKEDEKEKDKDKNDRGRRSMLRGGSHGATARNNDDDEFPEWVLAKIEALEKYTDGAASIFDMDHEALGGRLLHETEYSRALSFDLGDNYSIQVHYLLA